MPGFDNSYIRCDECGRLLIELSSPKGSLLCPECHKVHLEKLGYVEPTDE